MSNRNRGGGIRRIRVRASLTQPELAELAGMSLETVGRHERGKTDSDETYQRLVDALRGEYQPATSQEAFARIVQYEAGIAAIATDAVQACEDQGLSIIDRIIGPADNRNTPSPDESASAKPGELPARVVACAEALERRIEDSIGNDRALARAFAPDLLKFKEQPINEHNGLTGAQADALAQLVGALGVGFIAPCSLDLSGSLLQVKGVESGWLMHLVFNTQRGQAMTLQLDWETTPPSLLRPDCSFQIPLPDSPDDRRSTDRKTLIQANRVAPGFTMGEEWEEESIDALDRLPWNDAFFGVNQALLAREDSGPAPFADAPGSKLYNPYIKHLHAKRRLPDLKVIKTSNARSNIVLKAGVEERHVHSFFQNCLQAIKEARFPEDEDRDAIDCFLENKDVDEIIELLLTALKDKTDAPQLKELYDAVEDTKRSEDRPSAVRELLTKWGGRVSDAGSYLRNFETIGDWIMELLGKGV